MIKSIGIYSSVRAVTAIADVAVTLTKGRDYLTERSIKVCALGEFHAGFIVR